MSGRCYRCEIADWDWVVCSGASEDDGVVASIVRDNGVDGYCGTHAVVVLEYQVQVGERQQGEYRQRSMQ